MINLIVGPMFGGKSTELIRRLTRFHIAKKRVVLLRPSLDKRGYITHDNKKHVLKEVFCNRPSEFKDWELWDVIGIDEGQFFDHLQEDCVLFSNYGKIVIVAGLNGTSERKPFPQIQNLIPYVSSIDFESAVCSYCGEDAAYSFYRDKNKKVDVLVGGEDAYCALCESCYNAETVRG